MYGGGIAPGITFGNRISNGDSCNTLELSLSNHAGTHVDLPSHFDAAGKTLTEYPPGFWYSEKIECFFMDRNDAVCPGELIDRAKFERLIKKNNYNAEVILLKTGFGNNRESEIYWKKPPGIDPKLPDFLRERFPNIRLFGMDLISVSSFANRKAGRQAHEAFLKHASPILPIEDMNLSGLPESLSNLLIAPLYINEADGAPCTVFANIGL